MKSCISLISEAMSKEIICSRVSFYKRRKLRLHDESEF